MPATDRFGNQGLCVFIINKDGFITKPVHGRHTITSDAFLKLVPRKSGILTRQCCMCRKHGLSCYESPCFQRLCNPEELLPLRQQQLLAKKALPPSLARVRRSQNHPEQEREQGISHHAGVGTVRYKCHKGSLGPFGNCCPGNFRKVRGGTFTDPHSEVSSQTACCKTLARKLSLRFLSETLLAALQLSRHPNYASHLKREKYLLFCIPKR